MRIADMHCDTVSRVYYGRREGQDISLFDNDFSVDFKRMKSGGCQLQFFACFADKCMTASVQDDIKGMIKLFREETKRHSDIIRHVQSGDDIERSIAEGKMSALLTIEDGGVLGGSIDALHRFYDDGVRLITLTWNYENELGYPNRINMATGECLPETEHGLKDAGIEIVREMERLGMIVDVSHLGDAGFYDVAANTREPFVASHSNARAVAGHVRNLTDDMIRIIGSRGGVIGLNFCPAFLEHTVPKNEVSTADAMVRHIMHIRNVGGTEVCAIGSDFDGIHGQLEIPSCDKLGVLGDKLARAGLSFDEIDAVFAGNVLKFIKNSIKL